MRATSTIAFESPCQRSSMYLPIELLLKLVSAWALLGPRCVLRLVRAWVSIAANLSLEYHFFLKFNI